MTQFRRIRIIMALVVFLLIPPFFSWIVSPYGDGVGGQPAPSWLHGALVLVAVLSVLFVATPFLLEHGLRGGAAEKLRSRGKEPRVVILHNAIAGGGAVSILGFVFVIAGGPTLAMYVTSILSEASILYWAWRYRDVLAGSTSVK